MASILTYHRKMADFESSWLMLLKALTINDISLRTFYSIITKKELNITSSKLRWNESHQFNSTALSHTLRLSSQFVDNAFLNRLMSSDYAASTALVRHCRTCIDSLYHCSFFQMPWIANCPVHQVELHVCKACSSIFMDRKLNELRSKDGSRLCRHLKPFMQEPFAVHRLSEDACSAFSKWGESLAFWLKRASDIGTEDLHEITSVPLHDHSTRKRFIYWRYLETLIGRAPINIPAPAFDAARLCHESLNEEKIGKKDVDLEQWVQCFKSLKRHIYKRFVRPHRKCVNQFKRLTLTETRVLDHDARCSCALAYYSWLVTALNLYTMQDLNDRSIKPYAICGKFHRYAATISLRQVLLGSWVTFHDHWASYELDGWQDEAQCDLVVHIRNERSISWPYNLALMTTHSGKETLKNYYYPSGSFLLQQSLIRCRARRGRRLIWGAFKVQDSDGLLNTFREILFVVRRQGAVRNRRLYI